MLLRDAAPNRRGRFRPSWRNGGKRPRRSAAHPGCRYRLSCTDARERCQACRGPRPISAAILRGAPPGSALPTQCPQRFGSGCTSPFRLTSALWTRWGKSPAAEPTRPCCPIPSRSRRSGNGCFAARSDDIEYCREARGGQAEGISRSLPSSRPCSSPDGSIPPHGRDERAQSDGNPAACASCSPPAPSPPKSCSAPTAPTTCRSRPTALSPRSPCARRTSRRNNGTSRTCGPLPLHGGEARQFTRNAKSEHARWSPDGKHPGRARRSALALRPLRRRRPQAHHAQRRRGRGRLSPDGAPSPSPARSIPNAAGDDACNKEREEKREKGGVHARIVNHLFARHWTEWKEGKRTHVFVISSLRGGPARDVTPLDSDWPSFRLGGGDDFSSPGRTS